jgi:hypothetical protein
MIPSEFERYEQMEKEQLPVPKHKLHKWTHFAGLYAAEHVTATEVVIGATFISYDHPKVATHLAKF